MKYQKLISRFESNLDVIESRNDDILKKAENGISKTEVFIKKLRKKVIRQGFNSRLEEIRFFKHTKPQLLCRLIYYIKIFNIESRRPRNTAKHQIKYFNTHITRLQMYFNDNLEFYHYYRRGSTLLDDVYFTRGQSNLRLPIASINAFVDDQFSTCQDTSVATIMAHDMVISYLQKEIKKLKIKKKADQDYPLKAISSNLKWTSSKTDLIELIYALHSAGVFNNSVVELKKIASLFEQVFHIKLGNFYHTFVEIRARKSNPTKFLDELKQQLQNRLEDSDV
ncbi:RteC domain-containing protein [Sediminibacter sp. Hel_I_10]|uniref:RteC domain-containing protein n=1 Tax=Sediminibacter sp. Hel_I_10 TaxID=1392490 RepID=UPI000561CAA8|nr:RteC domain-containing protein [Sediminibacter sp. Hel_I_10]